jgi:hypothetical protein
MARANEAASWEENAVPHASVQSPGAVTEANRAARQIGSASGARQLAQRTEPL